MHLPLGEISQVLLFDIGVIVLLAAVLSYVFRALKQPGMIAYVLTGIVLGPFGLSLITNQNEIMALSELGVAFLLFMAGIELDFSKLGKIGKVVFLTSVVQIGTVFLSGFLIGKFLNFQGIEPYYIGLAVAFSSTMVVVKILSDKKKINALRGRLSIGVLLIQDIVIILVLSSLSKIGISASSKALVQTAINGLGLIAIAIVSGKYVLPRVLHYSAGNRELFFLVSVATAFFFIGIASVLGFSIAIGGFIGGLSLASYPYNTEIRNEILPLRNFFLVIFFASLGMQINLVVLRSAIVPLTLLFGVLFVVKPIIIMGVLSYFGYGSKTPVLVGFGLAQGSEFVFILADQGMKLGHIGTEIYTMLISLILISIAVTPYLHRIANKLADHISRKHPRGLISSHRIKNASDAEKKMKDHIVILGCDKTGGEILEEAVDHDVIVVDHNPEVLDRCLRYGYSCVYGEADSEEMLERVSVKDAKMLVSTIPDFETNSWLLSKVKEMNKDIKFITRAHKRREALEMYLSGADLVVLPERIAGEKMSEIVRKVKQGRENEVKKERYCDIEELNRELGE